MESRGAFLPRIIFVDDEERILNSLRRALRRRMRWDLVLCHSGDAALAALAEAPADVVVSDVNMPGMDGLTLLSRVQQVQPSALRFVLSGEGDQQAALRALPVAQQFLTKPIQVGALVQAIERGLALRELLAVPALQSLLGSLRTLPAVPRIYQELSLKVHERSVSAREIGAIIDRDPAIAARVLQVVNSALFALPRQVSSLEDAVTWLGINLLRSLVMATEVLLPFEGCDGVSLQWLEEVAAHGVLVGRMARRLCPDPLGLEEAYLAGLLHDLGRVVLAVNLPEHEQAVSSSGLAGAQLCTFERERIGTTHGEVGAYLLGSWGLSQDLVEAVAWHHEPSRSPRCAEGALAAVHAANAALSEVNREVCFPDEAWLMGCGILGILGRARELAADVLARGMA